MIIAFARTTGALLAGRKSCTRRDWSERTAEYFAKRLPANDFARMGVWHGIAADAYDKSPRNGGRKVATISVTSVGREPLRDMPDSDYEAEGFAWLDEQGVQLGDVWGIVPAREYPSLSKLAMAPSREYFDLARYSGRTLYIVRFELVAAAFSELAGAEGVA